VDIHVVDPLLIREVGPGKGAGINILLQQFKDKGISIELVLSGKKVLSDISDDNFFEIAKHLDPEIDIRDLSEERSQYISIAKSYQDVDDNNQKITRVEECDFTDEELGLVCDVDISIVSHLHYYLSSENFENLISNLLRVSKLVYVVPRSSHEEDLNVARAFYLDQNREISFFDIEEKNFMDL
jgi:hypothetical protein